MKNFPKTIELTVDEVEENVDLTIPENRSYKEADFFSVCSKRISKPAFKDYQTLSSFMKEDSVLV